MMTFQVKDIQQSNLAVSVKQDENDVDIVITNSKGEDHVIAYLDEDGLTLCPLCADSEVETNDDGYILHRENKIA